jgi:hypothetical protein
MANEAKGPQNFWFTRHRGLRLPPDGVGDECTGNDDALCRTMVARVGEKASKSLEPFRSPLDLLVLLRRPGREVSGSILLLGPVKTSLRSQLSRRRGE